MIWPFGQAGKPCLPPVWLEGERIIVRPPRLEDGPQWTEVRRRNRDFLKPYEPAWPKDCLSQEFFVRRFKQQVREWHKGTRYAFIILHKSTDRLIGGVNINNVSRGASQYATLGYWLDEQEQGQGYMSNALRLVIDFGFNELGLHRFNAGCLLHNDRSKNLLLKLGFEEEGFAKKYVKIDGRWQDHRLFGLPVEHWQEEQENEISALKSQSS